MRADQPVGGEAEVEAEEEEAMLCGVCDEDDSEEVRAPKIAPKPYVPTKAEVDAHYPLHAEYRSWCKYCVAGKAASRLHHAGKADEEPMGVTISIDYCFMVAEESEEGMDAILVGYDNCKKGFWQCRWMPRGQQIVQ